MYLFGAQYDKALLCGGWDKGLDYAPQDVEERRRIHHQCFSHALLSREHMLW